MIDVLDDSQRKNVRSESLRKMVSILHGPVINREALDGLLIILLGATQIDQDLHRYLFLF